jgi:uncharacterized damage-inducible protein DinB
MSDRSFVRANEETRERLARLVATLTPAQLEIDLGEGWTVASALAHMGFWDRWQAERWAAMLAGRWSADDDSVIAAEHLANEALHPCWAGAVMADAPALALAAAELLDALVAQAPDDLVEALEGSPSAYLLHRHRHRGEHLDHIERSIATAADAVDRSFVEKNAASRRRLASLVEGLSPVELALPTEPTEEGSWTVAQVLGHLLFWDRSMESRWRLALERAGESGPVDIVGIPMELTDAINGPLAGLIGEWAQAVGPQLGAQALAAAEAVDALVESSADRLPPGALATRPNAVNRWSHRESHLAQVEKALAAARVPGDDAVDRSYLDRNRESLGALRLLAGRLAPADLLRPTEEGGWTIGHVLGHLAFWDRYMAARWRAALAAGGELRPLDMPHPLADMLNDALAPTWQAMAAQAPEAVVAEALAAAEEIDGIVANLPPGTPVAAIVASQPRQLDRSLHRRDHVSAVERTVAAPPD